MTSNSLTSHSFHFLSDEDLFHMQQIQYTLHFEQHLLLPTWTAFISLPFLLCPSTVQAPRQLRDPAASAVRRQVSLAWREMECFPRFFLEALLSRPANWEKVRQATGTASQTGRAWGLIELLLLPKCTLPDYYFPYQNDSTGRKRF